MVQNAILYGCPLCCGLVEAHRGLHVLHRRRHRNMSTTDAQPTTGTQPHAWLHSSAMRAASDVCLALILLIAGTVAIWGAVSLGLGNAARLAAGSYPLVIGSLLLVIGIATLL